MTRRSLGRVPLMIAAAAVCGIGAHAHADDRPKGPRDPVAAEAAFEQGLALMREGKNAEACPKLEESQRLDPGVGVLLYLGECYERVGRLATAWATFREAAAAARQAGQTERDVQATERARALEGRLPKLTLVVPPQSRVAGLEILRDGVIVGESLWDSPVPVDPGDHTLEARAAGREPYVQRLTAREGAVDVVQIPELVPVRPAVEPPPRALPPVITPPTPKRTEPNPWSGARIAGVTIGSVGLLGVAVGGGFGVATITTWSEASDHCAATGEPRRCDADGVRLGEDAQAYGTASTVLFAVGGALTAGGLVLAIAAPDGEPVEVAISPAGLLLGASF